MSNILLYLAVLMASAQAKQDWSSPLPTLLAAPVPKANRTRLSMIALVSYSGPIFPMGPTCPEAAKIALQAIANSPLLDRYELVVELVDDMCLDFLGVRYSIDVMSGAIDGIRPNFSKARLPLFVGPTCSTSGFTGAQTEYFNFVAVQVVAVHPAIFTKRSMYKSYFSLSPSVDMFYEAIPAFIKSNGWSQVYLLTETQVQRERVEAILLRNMQRLNLTLAGTSKVLVLSGTLPTPDQFSAAVREMAAFEPRVIVINTLYGSILACWLHRYKLYGPDIVLIFFGFSYFLTNDRLRPQDALQCRLNCPFNVLLFWLTDNDTLSNWVTSSDNFTRNGSYIHSLVKASYERLHYKGLTLNDYSPMNALTGVTGFWQMQMVTRRTADLPLALAIEPILVASYNSSERYPLLKKGPHKLTWRTADGQAPYDSLRTIFVKTPIVSMTANSVIKGFTTALLLLTVASFGTSIAKAKLPAFAKAMPKLNSLILIGNALVLCFILILPSDGHLETLAPSCMAASLSLVVGFSLISSAILAKMESARLVFGMITSSVSIQAKRSKVTARNSQFLSTVRSQSAASQEASVRNDVIDGYLRKCSNYGVIGCLSYSALEALVLVICFVIEPITSRQFNRQFVMSPTSRSVARQFYTDTCYFNMESMTNQVMVAILTLSYAVIFLRSLILAIALRKVTLAEIGDLQFTRFVSYGVGIASFAGGAVVYGFLSNEPGLLSISVSSLAICVVTLSIAVIFFPKIRKIREPQLATGLTASYTGRSSAAHG